MNRNEWEDFVTNSMEDLVSQFLYYERKDDDVVTSEDIEKAIDDGTLSIEFLVYAFKTALLEAIGEEE